ncbi:MAG TPA: 4'-phosphopantetheinyl transferase superfamily protein [Gemmataceae bacterium]|nr:4'-phosphopantetheinyl transferase superfamily protein [Gemmataceae bacterium]
MDSAVRGWLSKELRPIPIPLPKDEVHVRGVRLPDTRSVLPALWRLLSPEERARHDRFHLQLDRDQFTLGRGGLRILLACYYRTAPVDVLFDHTPNGKPMLRGGTNPDGLTFSVAHACGLVVWAFARDRLVGIDTEPIRKSGDEAELVAAFFNPEETAAYRALPEAERTRGFFRAWTRKEAILKAVGVGLAEGLAGFAVTLAPGERARVLHGNPGGIHADLWSLYDLDIDPGHITTLAVLGSDVQVRLRL